MRMLFGVIAIAFVVQSVPYEIYVSPNGNNDGSGSKSDPIKSISRAIDSAVVHKAVDGSIVNLLPGTYYASTILLSSRHSNITVQGENMDSVILTGGVFMDMSKSLQCDTSDINSGIPEEYAQNVKKWSFSDLGISDTNFFSKPFISDGKIPFITEGEYLLPISSWPDTGYGTIDSVIPSSVIDTSNTNLPRGYTDCKFVLNDDIVHVLNTEAKHAYVGAFWCWDWYYSIEKVDTVIDHLVLADSPYVDNHYGYRKGARCKIFNLLSQINAPGKWAVDTEKKNVFLWPNNPSARHIVPGKDFRFFHVANASNVKIKNMTLTAGINNYAVAFMSCTTSVISNCKIKNVSGNGIYIYNDTGCQVVGCTIYNCGKGGVVVEMGNRPKLVPSNNLIANNFIHDIGINRRTHQYGIHLSHGSIGNRVTQNTVCNAPHIGISFYGTNQIVENNYLGNVGNDVYDGGGMYAGYSMTGYGTIVQNNLIENSGTTYFYALYLDDLFSGLTINNNIIKNNYNSTGVVGLTIGGGRDNTIKNNIFINTYSQNSKWLVADSRGTGFRIPLISVGGPICNELQLLKYTEDPWASTFPSLLKLFDDSAGVPKGNVVKHNRIIGYKNEYISSYVSYYGIIDSNYILDSSEIFIDYSIYGTQKNLNIDSIPPVVINRMPIVPLIKTKTMSHDSIVVVTVPSYYSSGICGQLYNNMVSIKGVVVGGSVIFSNVPSGTYVCKIWYNNVPHQDSVGTNDTIFFVSNPLPCPNIWFSLWGSKPNNYITYGRNFGDYGKVKNLTYGEFAQITEWSKNTIKWQSGNWSKGWHDVEVENNFGKKDTSVYYQR